MRQLFTRSSANSAFFFLRFSLNSALDTVARERSRPRYGFFISVPMLPCEKRHCLRRISCRRASISRTIANAAGVRSSSPDNARPSPRPRPFRARPAARRALRADAGKRPRSRAPHPPLSLRPRRPRRPTSPEPRALAKDAGAEATVRRWPRTRRTPGQNGLGARALLSKGCRPGS